jgi:hypothetical protein
LPVVRHFACLLASLLAVAACTTDHDRLAVTEPGSTTSGMGGAGGTGPTTTGPSSGGSGGIEEPPGPTKLTVVNGIADHDAIRLCFVPYPDGPGSEMPWPASLDFAAGTSVEPTDVVPPGTDVEVVVVAGSLGSTTGKTCASLLSMPLPGVIVRSLAVVPAAVFGEQKSLLFVPVGCAGGAGHTDEAQAFVCGARYSEAAPDPGLVAGFMSRINGPNGVPLQFVHAARGLEASEVRVKPGLGGAMAQIVADPWSHGAIAPFPPYLALSTQGLVSPPDASIELASLMNGQLVSSTTWSDAFAQSSLDVADVADGVGLTFVAVGAAPTIGEGPWWHAFTWTVVASDP